MSLAATPNTTTTAAPLRLTFDGGTILVEGLPEGDSRGVPGLKRDPRIGPVPGRGRSGTGRSSSTCSTTRSPSRTTPATTTATRWTIRIDKPAFPHQTEGLEAWSKAGKRGVVVLPTGTGKTHLANLCIQAAGRPTLIVTPTIDLMNQWYDELTLCFGVEVGLLGGGYYDIQPLTVTTYDSAYLNLDRLGNKFGLIVFDECHHLPGPTYGLAATCADRPVPPRPDRHPRTGRQRPRAARPARSGRSSIVARSPSYAASSSPSTGSRRCT